MSCAEQKVSFMASDQKQRMFWIEISKSYAFNFCWLNIKYRDEGKKKKDDDLAEVKVQIDSRSAKVLIEMLKEKEV